MLFLFLFHSPIPTTARTSRTADHIPKVLVALSNIRAFVYLPTLSISASWLITHNVFKRQHLHIRYVLANGEVAHRAHPSHP